MKEKIIGLSKNVKPIDQVVKEKIIGLSKEGKDHYQILRILNDSNIKISYGSIWNILNAWKKSNVVDTKTGTGVSNQVDPKSDGYSIQEQELVVTSESKHEPESGPSGCPLYRFIPKEDLNSQPQIPEINNSDISLIASPNSRRQDIPSTIKKTVNQPMTITDTNTNVEEATSQPSADIEDTDFDEDSDWKKRVQDSDYESIRELSVFYKKQGMTLNALASCIRVNNYIQSLGASANESTLESLIANMANYPDHDPAKLIEVAQILESGTPLEKLEEHVNVLKSEKEKLQREIDEKRATLDGVYADVESRRKLVEEYAQMRVDMRRYGIGPEDPRKIQTCFQQLKDANYNAEEIVAGYANMQALRKERMELDEDRRAFEARLATVKDVLPLAEQLLEIMADGYNNILSIFFYIISSLITMTVSLISNSRC